MKFKTKLVADGMGPHCGAVVPSSIVARLGEGKVRVPVRVTINGYTFPTTTFRMGGPDVRIGLNKGNVSGARVAPGQTVSIDISRDETVRTVAVPPSLARVFRRDRAARAAWEKLSYTRRREMASSINEAKREETAARRLEKALSELRA